MTAKCFSTFLLLFLACIHQVNSLSTQQDCSRRSFVGWVGAAAGACTLPASCAAKAGTETRVDELNVDNYLRSGFVAQPMGVSGQAGKSRPETGIVLRDGSDVSRDSRTGDVLAEIVVDGSDGKTAVLASYSSPWPLATGTVFDVECRDAKSGDGAFLSVSPNVGGKSIEQVKDAFILENLLRPDGRFSFYGPPTDVKVLSSNTKDGYKVMDISFSTISQATQTEIPRKARLSATVPTGTNQAVVLVASASALRWKKGSDKTIASAVESFRAIPAPKTSMKIRGKERGREPSM